MKLDEITLERVRLAYSRTGLVPSSGFRGGQYACALYALAQELGLPGLIAVLPNYSQRNGFIDGFEGVSPGTSPSQDIADYEEAYQRGREIAIGLKVAQRWQKVQEDETH